MTGPDAAAGGPEATRQVDLLGRVCLFLGCMALIVMIGVVALDIVTRAAFNFSFTIAEEVSGYMLVAFTFLSLAVVQMNDGFHRVEFLIGILPPRGREILRLAFDLVTLAFVLLLLYQYTHFVIASYKSGARAPTYLSTPIWLPQSVMVLGSLTFLVAVTRSILIRGAALRRSANAEAAS